MSIAGIIFGVFCVALLFSCVLIVREKEATIVEVFGKFQGVYTAGLNFKPPWPIGYVRGSVSLKISEIGTEIGVKSSDNAFMNVMIRVQFQILEDQVRKAYYELENAEQQISSYIINNIRSRAASMTMDELFKSKDELERGVTEALNAKFATYGYKIINVLVDDPQPSEQLRDSFDRVLASLREKEAATNEAESLKIKRIGEANAEAESLTIKAKAFVEFRNTVAEGNVAAVKKFTEGVADLAASDVLHFFAGMDQRDAIRDASKGPGTIIIVATDPHSANTQSAAHVAALTEALQKQS